MGTYLRISNRGACPRLLLQIIGATTKRERWDDPSQGGWFGTDTKFCPIPALRLGIKVIVSSSDEEGPYGLTYVSKRRAAGPLSIERVLIEYQGGPAVETMFSVDACMNWDKPIGDDTMATYRILRGYLRNAYDIDPKGYRCRPAGLPEPAPDGETLVHLTWHREFGAMLAQADRYFKWHARTKPLMRFVSAAKDGAAATPIGAIYPKSEPGATRLFSQGSLAFCSKKPEDATLFDYDADDKSLVSEERTFKTIGEAMIQFNRMLCAWEDVGALKTVIVGIMEGRAPFEEMILGWTSHLKGGRPQAADAWLKAWQDLYGPQAILASDAAADPVARQSFEKRPVVIPHKHLRDFLKRCGAEESRDFVPKGGDVPEYREIPLERLEEWERAKLGLLLPVIHREYPETIDYVVRVYEPLTARMRMQLGFCAWGEGRPTTIWLQRGLMLSNTSLLRALVHEARHGRMRQNDESREFVWQADGDLVRELMPKHDIPYEPEVDITDLPLLDAEPLPEIEIEFDTSDDKA